MKYLKNLYRLLVCTGDILYNKKSSENDLLTGHFQSFFFLILTLNLKKNSVNQLIKKNLALIGKKLGGVQCIKISSLMTQFTFSGSVHAELFNSKCFSQSECIRFQKSKHGECMSIVLILVPV